MRMPKEGDVVICGWSAHIVTEVWEDGFYSRCPVTDRVYYCRALGYPSQYVAASSAELRAKITSNRGQLAA